MNTTQRTLCEIPPRWWFAAIEAEARVDGALRVRACPIAVDGGRHARQGRGHRALAHAMPSQVRQALLAQNLSQGRNRLAAARCVRGSGGAGGGGVEWCRGAGGYGICILH